METTQVTQGCMLSGFINWCSTTIVYMGCLTSIHYEKNFSVVIRVFKRSIFWFTVHIPYVCLCHIRLKTAPCSDFCVWRVKSPHLSEDRSPTVPFRYALLMYKFVLWSNKKCFLWQVEKFLSLEYADHYFTSGFTEICRATDFICIYPISEAEWKVVKKSH